MATGSAYKNSEYTPEQNAAMNKQIDMQNMFNQKGMTLLDNAPQVYQQKDYAALLQQATDQYTPQYNAEVEAANNSLAATRSAIERNIAQLGRNYDAQIQQNAANYARNADTLNGNMTARGMGRSSYAASLLNNNMIQGAKAANALRGEQTQKTMDYYDQLMQAETQNANTLGRLAADREANIRSYAQQLSDSEFNKEQQSQQNYNSYVLQLLGNKMFTDGAGKKSSSSKKTSKKTTTTTVTPTAPTTTLPDLVTAWRGA